MQIDHSIIESFGGDGKTCITARVYPMLGIGRDAHLYAFNNGTSTLVISKLSAWSMKNAEIKNEESNFKFKASQKESSEDFSDSHSSRRLEL